MSASNQPVNDKDAKLSVGGQSLSGVTGPRVASVLEKVKCGSLAQLAQAIEVLKADGFKPRVVSEKRSFCAVENLKDATREKLLQLGAKVTRDTPMRERIVQWLEKKYDETAPSRKE